MAHTLLPKVSRATLLIATIAVLQALPVSAADIPNARFDTDTSGWTPLIDGGDVRVELFWRADDVDDSPTSGSGAVVNTSSGGQPGSGTFPLNSTTCVPIDPGATYDARVWVKIPVGQTETGRGRLGIAWVEGNSCSGTFAGFGPSGSPVSAPGDWTLWEVLDIAPPVNAGSVRIGLTVFKNEAGGVFEARFDEVEFVPEPATSGTLAVVCAMGALAMRGRRRHLA